MKSKKFKVVCTGLCLVLVCVLTYLVLNNNSVCAFKQATGVPCPTCGGTRAVKCLLRLDLVGAWNYNPYVYALILWLVLYPMCWKKQKFVLCIIVSVVNILFLFGCYAIRYFSGALFLL